MGRTVLALFSMDQTLNWNHVPSGNDQQLANLKMAIEIVDLPTDNGDFP